MIGDLREWTIHIIHTLTFIREFNVMNTVHQCAVLPLDFQLSYSYRGQGLFYRCKYVVTGVLGLVSYSTTKNKMMRPICRRPYSFLIPNPKASFLLKLHSIRAFTASPPRRLKNRVYNP